MITNKYGHPSISQMVRDCITDGPLAEAEILRRCVDQIPASAAARAAEKRHPNVSDMEIKILKGKRYLVQHAIDQMKFAKRLSTSGIGINRIVSLTEEVSTNG